MVAPLPELVSDAAKFQPIRYVKYREFLFPKTGKLPDRTTILHIFFIGLHSFLQMRPAIAQPRSQTSKGWCTMYLILIYVDCSS